MKRQILIIAILYLITSICIVCSGNTMEGGNARPEFLTDPVLETDHNREYNYTIQLKDDDGDSLSVSAQHPSWLSFDESMLKLTGIAMWENIGSYQVRITVSDGIHNVEQKFTLTVMKGNIICNTDFGDPAESPYILPYQVGKMHQVIQSYCPANPNWGHAKSFAYDFDTAIGDTIIAMREGTITLVKEDSEDNTGVGGANTLYIRQHDGSMMQYVHFTKNGVLVKVGDQVKQGQPIALSGNTGASSGPHVHVWVFRDNTDFTRKATLPFNFRNAQGPLDSNRGLIHLKRYTALPFN